LDFEFRISDFSLKSISLEASKNQSGSSILFRADASADIGTGHVMRCLALAQRLIDRGGQAIFAMSEVTPKLQERLEDEKCKIIKLSSQPYGEEDVKESSNIAKNVNALCTVIDGYNFGAKYQRLWKKTGARTLFVDDYGHSGYYCCDFVLNQSLFAHEALYRERDLQTKLLLGTSFVMLRREFLHFERGKRRAPDLAKHILVTLGGADIANVTRTVIETVQKLKMRGTETVVVVGGSNPNIKELQKIVDESPVAMKLLYNIKNMPELMQWADLAVSASGTTCYELSYMGVPTIAIIIADNQVAFAEQMDAAGSIKSLGRPSPIIENQLSMELERMITDQTARTAMIEKQSELVDGLGADRVLMHVLGEPMMIREVRPLDCGLLFEWANDPAARSVSFSSGTITMEEHEKWFKEKLNDENSFIFIGIDREENEVGVVKFDVDADESTVSINVAPDFRGKGFGKMLLKLACGRFSEQSHVRAINAYVKPENAASINLFEKGGFSNKGLTEIKGQKALHFVKSAVILVS